MISQNSFGFSANYPMNNSNVSSSINSINSTSNQIDNQASSNVIPNSTANIQSLNIQTNLTGNAIQVNSNDVRLINRRKRKFDSTCSTEDSPYDSDDNFEIITGFEDGLLETILSKQIHFDKDVILDELVKQRFINQATKYEQIKEQTIHELRSNRTADRPDYTRRQLF